VQTASDPRYRKRLPCRLEVPNGAYSGMVLNLSRGGLFVQTSAAASPGEAVHLDLSLVDAAGIGLDARVVWRRVVAPHLRSVSTGGMGVHIQYAHDAYFGLVAQLAEGTPADEPTPAPAPRVAGPAFRVRLRLAGGPRTRVVVVAAADAGDARTRARQLAGAQWVVLDLEEIEREA
jgi:Tfp pilus assembly protein PilZ